MSYKNLRIWQQARALSIEIHLMSLKLPGFEQVETGRQIRRSSKSIRSNIVEGYGRRRYKSDFIKFIVYALSSCDETIDHLETLCETGSLSDRQVYDSLHSGFEELCRNLINFLKTVEKSHNQFPQNS